MRLRMTLLHASAVNCAVKVTEECMYVYVQWKGHTWTYHRVDIQAQFNTMHFSMLHSHFSVPRPFPLQAPPTSSYLTNQQHPYSWLAWWVPVRSRVDHANKRRWKHSSAVWLWRYFTLLTTNTHTTTTRSHTQHNHTYIYCITASLKCDKFENIFTIYQQIKH